MQIISTIFRKVADALYDGASAVGITYNEINILVYYLLIPLTWTILFDCWLGTPIMTYALVFIWFGIKIGTWGRFREMNTINIPITEITAYNLFLNFIINQMNYAL